MTENRRAEWPLLAPFAASLHTTSFSRKQHLQVPRRGLAGGGSSFSSSRRSMLFLRYAALILIVICALAYWLAASSLLVSMTVVERGEGEEEGNLGANNNNNNNNNGEDASSSFDADEKAALRKSQPPVARFGHHRGKSHSSRNLASISSSLGGAARDLVGISSEIRATVKRITLELLEKASNNALLLPRAEETKDDLKKRLSAPPPPALNLRDAAEMRFNLSCSAQEQLNADIENPNSDCGLLQAEFGMCHAFTSVRGRSHAGLGEEETKNGKMLPITKSEEEKVRGRNRPKQKEGKVAHEPTQTLGDLNLVSSPYAQGYVTLKGLEDPVEAIAAIIDERRRAMRGEDPLWPLTGVHATIDGIGTDTDSSKEAQQEEEVPLRAGNAPFKPRPFVLDIVYTEVDFSEASFQADRLLFLERIHSKRKKRGGGGQQQQGRNKAPTPRDKIIAAHLAPLVHKAIVDEAARNTNRQVVFGDDTIFSSNSNGSNNSGGDGYPHSTLSLSRLFGEPTPSELSEYIETVRTASSTLLSSFNNPRQVQIGTVSNVSGDMNNDDTDVHGGPNAESDLDLTSTEHHHDLLPRALHAYQVSQPDEASRRFRNFNELRYSLRGIYRYIIEPMQRHVTSVATEKQQRAAKEETTSNTKNNGKRNNPYYGRYSVGKIYIIVSHKSQAPTWMKEAEALSTTLQESNLHNTTRGGDIGKVVLVEHRDLFPDPSRSLPNFNSMSIESVIHRIPNLSRHYIYLNNDFMITRPVSFFDFFQPFVVYKPAGGGNGPPSAHAVPLEMKTANSNLGGRPVVKWLPAIRSCGVSLAPSFTKNTLLWKHLQTAFNVETLKEVAEFVNEPNKSPLGFAATFSHIPQLYDKLQVMRMMTEPRLRERLCRTRGWRTRESGTFVTMFMYQHYSVLWRHGWGPDAPARAVLSIGGDAALRETDFPPIGPSHSKKQLRVVLRDRNNKVLPFVDSLGMHRATLWDWVSSFAKSSIIATAPARGAPNTNNTIDQKGGIATNVTNNSPLLQDREKSVIDSSYCSSFLVEQFGAGRIIRPASLPHYLSFSPMPKLCESSLAQSNWLAIFKHFIAPLTSAVNVAMGHNSPTEAPEPRGGTSSSRQLVVPLLPSTNPFLLDLLRSSRNEDNEASSHSLKKALNATENVVLPTITRQAPKKTQPGGAFASSSTPQPQHHEHWLVDICRATRDTIISSQNSKLTFFGMPRTVATLREHQRIVAESKAEGSSLFLTENDDMPAGDRDPSVHGFFGNLPGFAVDQICALPSQAWAEGLFLPFVKTYYYNNPSRSSSSLDTPLSTYDKQEGRNVNNLMVRFELAQSLFPFNITSADSLAILFTSDAVGDFAKKKSNLFRQTSSKGEIKGGSSVSVASIGAWLANRVSFACAQEEASVALSAARILVQTKKIDDPLSPSFPSLDGSEDHDDEARSSVLGQSRCSIVSRFGLIDMEARRHRERLVATFSRDSDGVSSSRRGAEGKKYFGVTFFADDRNRSSVHTSSRHDCSLIPIPPNEIPPAAGVYGVDVFLDILRTAVGDCDTSLLRVGEPTTRRPPWELPYC